METVTFGGGCFWCTEAIFKRLKGVKSVVSGYAGGTTENPTYMQVSSGNTGHAEAIQIKFDPEIISFEKLLEVFFATHDPTTLNQQGADVGTQYRSVIFYHNDSKKQIAEKKIKPSFVTQIEPYKNFYPAEDYHQNYYDRNKDQNPYCTLVIDPKIQKLMKDFKKDLKYNP
ncbi:MAG: peptide-methionine (S)-S-oxide reductase [Microgenomates group bacterium Gr01-1014_7]|nr:MAG: peptide-methionine (S)-S-oxide reductase [Microgenomates group bacterium Gr01-1014_7]